MSINNKRSYTEYTVTQPTTDFAIGFDDFDEGGKDNILVTLNGVLVESLGYAALRKNENTVTITPAITEGTVRLTRETDIDEPFHKFTAGALFSAKSMDENFQQVRHSQQEVRDGFEYLEFNTNGIVQEAKAATTRANNAAGVVEGLTAIVDTRVAAVEASQANVINRVDNFIATDVVPVVNDAINNTAVEGGVLADTFVTATAYHPDTYARTQRSIRADTTSLLDFIPLELHEGIKTYTYAVDLKEHIQKAIDYCVLNNKKLNVPAGGYLVDSAYVPLYLTPHWGADKNCVIEGAGQGLTVIKEADGATNRGGRYTKIFYIHYGGNSHVGDFGHISISNITFNKNASSNVLLPNDTLYTYEQAGIVAGAGTGKVNFKSFHFYNLEFIDKIGKGLALASSPNVKIGKVLCENVYSRYHPKIDDKNGDGTFGQRGCLEFGTSIDIIDLVNCDVIYAQIEPTIASSKTLQRRSSVSGGRIDTFEWTDRGGYSFASVTNLSCVDKLLTRGIHANIVNCMFTPKGTFSDGIIKILNSTVLLKYDAITNRVEPLTHGFVSGYTAYSELWLNNVNIRIDSDDPNISPDNEALSGGITGALGSRKRFINNVSFDSRLKGSVYAYGNGDWVISNCDLYGSSYHIIMGAVDASKGGSVELINNNYLGSGSVVNLRKVADNWTLKITGTYPYKTQDFFALAGSTTYSGNILQTPLLYSATKPTGKNYPVGQTVTNTNPVEGGYEKWVKTDELTATWKGVGLIEGDVAATSGTTEQRPTGVAVGFAYFDTTLGKPIYFKSTGVWVDAAGTTV